MPKQRLLNGPGRKHPSLSNFKKEMAELKSVFRSYGGSEASIKVVWSLNHQGFMGVQIEESRSNLRKEENSTAGNLTRDMAKFNVDAGNKDDQVQTKNDGQPKKKDKPKKNKTQKKKKTKRARK